ncbi:MAG TPA: sigma-54 dependent transcriptional regulator [Candidatus Brocadiia bacterium]|nr:sigma-54 dependent transcriptional regulator [Candidatus Brocadiia bacterium]
MKKPIVLVLDDKKNMLRLFERMLGKDYEVLTSEDPVKGLELFDKNNIDVVVTDIRMPHMTGLDVLKHVKGTKPGVEVILMTAYAEVSQAVEAVKQGAFNYIMKPFDPDEMTVTVGKAVERRRLIRRNEFLEGELKHRYGFSAVIGDSPPMQKVIAMARKAAETDANVLITGESGTGKEVFARAIHYTSRRCDGRFVAVNCAAIPRELLESELFGHMKGAFSGAISDKRGLFEEADGSTIFLDEISELNLDVQVKINRAIQEGEIRAVGDVKDKKVDVRIIAATNKDLRQASRDGLFREDLFFRLNVFPIQLPPLRERKEDIPRLVEDFIAQSAEDHPDMAFHATPQALTKLQSYDWPGNVRELQNVVERALVLADGEALDADLFLIGDSSSAAGVANLTELSYREAMDRLTQEAQRNYILEVLRINDGNVTNAAQHAGIERESFHRLMRKCNIKADDVRKK